MFPAVTPQNRLGRPSAPNGAGERQAGWAMMPTRKPCASSRRPMRAAPKLGWSTYASPVTSTTSQLSQPSASISAADMGSTGAVPNCSAQNFRRANSVAGTRSGDTGCQARTVPPGAGPATDPETDRAVALPGGFMRRASHSTAAARAPDHPPFSATRAGRGRVTPHERYPRAPVPVRPRGRRPLDVGLDAGLAGPPVDAGPRGHVRLSIHESGPPHARPRPRPARRPRRGAGAGARRLPGGSRVPHRQVDAVAQGLPSGAGHTGDGPHLPGIPADLGFVGGEARPGAARAARAHPVRAGDERRTVPALRARDRASEDAGPQ